MDKIYQSVRTIEKEYSKWIKYYPDYYMYPIATANRIFEHNKWKFFKIQAKKYAANKIEFIKILVIIRRLHQNVNK